MDLVRSGRLGPARHVVGDMAFQLFAASPARDRFVRSDLGGGAMLDIGSYLVQFATLFLDATPDHAWTVHAVGAAVDGVDMDTTFMISAGNATASFGTSLLRASDFKVQVFCEHGVVVMDAPANCPASASFVAYEDASTSQTVPVPCCAQPQVASQSFAQALPPRPPHAPPAFYPNGQGFAYVIAAVEQCLATPGCLELDELTLEHQLRIVRITEEVLRAVGVYRHTPGM